MSLIRGKIVIHILFPLIMGGFIYISFRSMSLRLFNWFEILGLKNTILSIRNIMLPLKKKFPSWVYFSLPDALWVYSFSSALILLWGDQFKNGKYWLIIPLFFGVLVEFAQKVKIFPGTFDLLDFTFSILALALSVIILKPKIQINEGQN